MNKNLLFSSLFLFSICTASQEALSTQEESVISVDAQTITTECETITPEPNITATECETFVADAQVIATATEATITEAETIVENVEATTTEEVEVIATEETETIVTETEVVTEEADAIATEEADAIATETEVITEEVEAIATETESEFTPSLLVFDFIIELESLTEDWLNLMNSTKTLITRCADSQEENTTEATLHLAQAIYNQAINENNSDAHGSLCASLYETSNVEKNAAIECSAPNYIAIRCVVTRNNDSNQALWLTLQELVQAVQNALQATQEETQEVVETTEHPITMMSNAVQKLLTIAQEDDNKSVSKCLYISAVANNTAE